MSELEELRALVETQKAEIKKLYRIATDHRYMKEAYREMLGPIGLEVAKAWDKRGVTRQHTSWGPDALVSFVGDETFVKGVGVQGHYCRNYFGTAWVRYDWYLQGRKVPFNHIMASIDEIKRERGIK